MAKFSLNFIATGLSLFINSILMTLKIVVGILFNSVSLLADGFDSLLDLIMSVFAGVGEKMGKKPADRDHPFGHEKFQFLLSLAIVVFMIFSSYQIAEEAINRLINQDFLVFKWIILIVALTSIVGKFFLSYVLFVIGKKLNSPSLLSLSKNFRSDVIVSFLVVGAIIGAYFEVYWLDPVLALLIVVVIILTGYDIAKDSLPILLDRGPPEDIVKLIEEKGLECEHVKEVHLVRLRRVYDQWTGDFHILVDEDMKVKDAHFIAEKLKKKLEDTGSFKDIVIHIEPYNSQESLKKQFC